MTTTPDPDGIEAEAVAADLPTAHERRLHPLSWLFVLVSSIGRFLVPLVALVVLGGRGEDSWQLAAAGIGVAALVVGAVWRYFTWRYRIGSDSLFVRSGLLERSLRQIPFSRIHDVAVHRPCCTGCSPWPRCGWNRPAATSPRRACRCCGWTRRWRWSA